MAPQQCLHEHRFEELRPPCKLQGLRLQEDCRCGFLMNVWLRSNVFMNIGFSFNVMCLNRFFMHISFSGNIFMNIWLGGDFFMHIGLSNYVMSLQRFIMDIWFSLNLIVNIWDSLNCDVLILWSRSSKNCAEQENVQQKFHFVLMVYLAIIEWV